MPKPNTGIIPSWKIAPCGGCPGVRNDEAQWDGVRLQPIAEPLYDLAKETLEQGLGDEVVVDRIKALLTQK